MSNPEISSEDTQQKKSGIIIVMHHIRDHNPDRYEELKKGGIKIYVSLHERNQLVHELFSVDKKVYTFTVETADTGKFLMNGSLKIKPGELEELNKWMSHVNQELANEGFTQVAIERE